MFGALPKLFDRSFFIGYFLPASLLFSGVVGNLIAFVDLGPKFWDFLVQKSTFGVAVSIVIIWLISIFLMAITRPLIRFLEGYGRHNPLSLFQDQHVRIFKGEIEPLLGTFKNVMDTRINAMPAPSSGVNRGKLRAAVTNYPEREGLVLPTRLGNIMRAYERYSDIVYGIESIVMWPRLLMVVPEAARDRIREGESLFHFALNILFVGTITFLLFVGLSAESLYENHSLAAIQSFLWPAICVPLISVFFGWLGWWLLPIAAMQRGEQVKSIFDLYRAPLAEALGLQLPATDAEERKMWQLVSRRMELRASDYRLLDYRKGLSEFRRKSDIPSTKDKEKTGQVDSKEDEKEQADALFS